MIATLSPNRQNWDTSRPGGGRRADWPLLYWSRCRMCTGYGTCCTSIPAQHGQNGVRV